jgi:hypothetical protein
MPEQKNTATDQLAIVIDAIQLGRKTGVLTVERGAGKHFEEGAIIFVNGQPVRARVGQRNTAESLKWLTTWGACRFAFVPSLPPDLALSSPNVYELSPSNATPRDGGFSGRASDFRPPGERSNGAGPANTSTFLHAMPYRIRQVDEALYLMEQRGFSRAHRHLFLLLDGRRTIKDLVLLTGRSPVEVYGLLTQLEQAGLIRQ